MIKFNQLYLNYGIPSIILASGVIMYFWYINSKNVKTNDRIMQGVSVFSAIAFSLSFVQLVVDAYNNSLNNKKITQMNLSNLNNSYWIAILKTFENSNGGLDNLASEIFVDWKRKSEPNARKEYFIIHRMFQMMVDIFRVNNIDDELTLKGWNHTFEKIIHSKKVQKHWKINKYFYGNKHFHNYIDYLLKNKN